MFVLLLLLPLAHGSATPDPTPPECPPPPGLLERLWEALPPVPGFVVFTCVGPRESAALHLGRVNQAVEIFRLRKKRLPRSLDEVYADAPVPVDPWGQPFVLLYDPAAPDRYDLVSWGADGLPGDRCGLPDGADIRWSAMR